jgi:hypothetical protein
MPTARSGGGGAVIDGKVYVAGGRFGAGFNSETTAVLEIYDPATNRWTASAPMPTPTHGLTGAPFVNGRIHLPGGAVTQGGHSGSVIHWTYRPGIACR